MGSPRWHHIDDYRLVHAIQITPKPCKKGPRLDPTALRHRGEIRSKYGDARNPETGTARWFGR
jgi:hypothetical protein